MSIFKQNATKVFKDKKLVKEANYTYDTDGYPISCGFTEYLNSGETRSSNTLIAHLVKVLQKCKTFLYDIILIFNFVSRCNCFLH